MSIITVAIDLPFSIDDEFEPAPSTNEVDGHFGMAGELNSTQLIWLGERLSEKNEFTRTLRFFAYDFGMKSHCYSIIGSDALENVATEWSHMNMIVWNTVTRNAFFRHQENELIAYFGDKKFLGDCNMRFLGNVCGLINSHFLNSFYSGQQEPIEFGKRFIRKYEA